LDELILLLADALAPRVAAEMSGVSAWIDQKGSPLGRNRHVAAVKRRAKDGEKGAALSGRRFLLSPAALKEEMSRALLPPVKVAAPAPANDERSDARTRLLRKLGRA
jgi:hypothetical protein